MSDQIPTPDELGEIRKWALAYTVSERRFRETKDLADRAGEVQARASLKAIIQKSGACCSMGWPDETAKVLADICRIFGGALSSPMPSQIADFEARARQYLVIAHPANPAMDRSGKRPKKDNSPGRPPVSPLSGLSAQELKIIKLSDEDKDAHEIAELLNEKPSKAVLKTIRAVVHKVKVRREREKTRCDIATE